MADGVKPLDPNVVKFARSIRDVFGPGVKLYRPEKWPGGTNVKAKPRG